MDTRPPAAGTAADPVPPHTAAAPPGSRPRGLAAASDQDRTSLWVVLVAGFVLRFWNLGAHSVWTDEGTAWTASLLPLRALIDFCLHKDASPPLFYLLTALALKFGGSEAHLRAVSAIASTLLVWVTYRYVRLFADRRTATIAAALLAFSPFQLMYAQEARTYALVALWLVTAQYLFARVILFDRPRAFAPWVAVSVLGLYTQGIALLGVAAQGAFAVLTATGRRNLGRFVLGQGIAAALYLPWFLAGLTGSHLESSHWYVEQPLLHNSMQVLRAVLVSPISLVTPPEPSTLPGLGAFLPRPLAWALLFGPTLLALALALPRLRDPGHRGLLARFTLAAIVIPLVAVLIVSFRRPLWLPRYFVFLGPMAAAALALGVTSIPRRWASMALAAALLLVSSYASFRVLVEYTKEPWRDAAKLVAATSDPANTAVIVTFDPDPFLFYNAKLATPFRVFAAAHPDVPFHDRYTQAQLGAIYRGLRDSTDRFDDVWVVVRSPGSDARRRVAMLAHQAARTFRAPVLRDTLDSVQGPLRVSRWVNRPRGTEQRVEMRAGQAWADSVIAAGAREREAITRPFTRAELASEADRVRDLIARLPDRSQVSIKRHELPDSIFVYDVAEDLGAIGAAAVPALVGRLDTSDDYECMLAIYALLLATQDEAVQTRTNGDYFRPPGSVLDEENPRTGAPEARAWWAKHRHFWDDAR